MVHVYCVRLMGKEGFYTLLLFGKLFKEKVL